MQKIVVIGSSNVDFVMTMDHLPRLGETVTDAHFMQTYGGKGANQAVGAARAGGDTWFVNCVGDDPFGPLVKQNLRQMGVHVEYVFEVEGVTSGTALVMVDDEGHNYLSVAPGANYHLTTDMLDQLDDLIATAGMVVLQYEVPVPILRKAIEMAIDAGVPVMFNLAPARELDRALLAQVDYLIVNEVEAEFLCGLPVDTPAAYPKAADALLATGAKHAIITLGAQGSFVADGQQQVHVPAYPVKPVDTTAAGDVFCGALAVALVESKPLVDAVRFANAASALSVTQIGAQPSIPARAEIDRMVRIKNTRHLNALFTD